MTETPSVPKLPVPVAHTIAPPDLADSTLLDVGQDPQMSLGTVELESHLDVAFSTVHPPNGEPRELKADVWRH
jgi:hypothetical protein